MKWISNQQPLESHRAERRERERREANRAEAAKKRKAKRERERERREAEAVFNTLEEMKKYMCEMGSNPRLFPPYSLKGLCGFHGGTSGFSQQSSGQ